MFALLHLPEWGPTQKLIREVFDRALSNTCAFSYNKGDLKYPGVWTAICGLPPVESFLRQEKLLMAARLKVGDYKAGQIFRGLLKDDHGSFESDITKALSSWSLEKIWNELSKDNISLFKRKVKRFAKRQWPRGLGMDGKLSWLYHNHKFYSGNVPVWADWVWPKNGVQLKSAHHFVRLLTGSHPAWGENPVCSHARCLYETLDNLYKHHFFNCPDHAENRTYFKSWAHQLFREKDPSFNDSFPISMLEAVLLEPSPVWVGLMDRNVFKAGVKLRVIHELHRIVTMASIFSWGRYFTIG